MSLFYRPPVHVYVEMTTDWVRLSVGDWLDVGLYKRLRGIYWPRWLGRLACRMDHHDWFIHELPWIAKDRVAHYVCLRCKVVK